jgi:hypothetical protein
MRIRLIGEANGAGISRDLELLGAALRACGCEVSVRVCGKPDRRRRRSALLQWRMKLGRGRRTSAGGTDGGHDAPGFDVDVNVMLEHIWPQFMAQARYNIVVPNPEWFDPRDERYLPAFDGVWAKTAFAERLFRERGCATVRIGFDSDDRMDAGVGRVAQFLHVAGRSPLKGTARLVSLWQRHPEWPTLTLVQDSSVSGAVVAAAPPVANIAWHGQYVSDDALRALQNAHRFHVCTSEAEGWGHYIAEAMSVAAVTLTCDAAPMNELIAPQRGLTVAAATGPVHNLVRLALFEEAALAAAVRRAMALGRAELDAMSAAARSWFLENKAGFVGRVGEALGRLDAPRVH